MNQADKDFSGIFHLLFFCMAIYHYSQKPFSRGKGQSAKAKSDYISREGRYANDKDEVLFKESGNMPKWAENDPSEFWDGADTYERSNARLGFEVVVALPKELSEQKRIELARELARNVTGKEFPYTLAVHRGGNINPHAHLIFSEREQDGIERSAKEFFKRANPKDPNKGGAKKNRTLKSKSFLQVSREAWQDLANRYLKEAGSNARIDRRTLKDQGIERIPQLHIGVKSAAIFRKGKTSDRMTDIFSEVKFTRDLEKELSVLEKTQAQDQVKHKQVKERGQSYER